MALSEQLIKQAKELAKAHAMSISLRVQSFALRHPLFYESVDLAHDISIHFQWGADQGDLIKKRRPYESKSAQKYRMEVAEQITFPHAQKVVGIITGALFSSEHYGLQYPEVYPNLAVREKKTFGDYIKDIPNVGNIERYIKDSVVQLTLCDPNGWIVMLPNKTDEEIIDGSEIHEVYPAFVPSHHILDYDNDFLLAVSSETVQMNNGGEGVILYYFTPDHTILIVENGKDSNGDPDFNIFPIHTHMSGKLYAHQLGGVLSPKSTGVLSRRKENFYLSHISPVLPYWNQVVREYSDITASITNHLHPMKYEMPLECDECSGAGEREYGGTQDLIACRKCKGSGRLSSSTSPLVGYTVELDENGKLNAPADYITNDVVVDIISKSMEWIQFNIKEGYRSVNMEMLFDTTTSAQTAESKRYDRELLHNFLSKVRDTIFETFQFILDSTNDLNYGVLLSDEQLKENRIIAGAPRTFDTTNPMEAIERIELANKANMGTGTRSKLEEAAIMRIFGSESLAGKQSLNYSRLDPYPNQVIDDLLSAQMLGAIIDEVELNLKINLQRIVQEATFENANFLDFPLDRKRAIVLEKSRKMIEEAKAKEEDDSTNDIEESDSDSSENFPQG